MHPVPLYDTLGFERTESGRVELTCSHPGLPVDSTNLVWRAAAGFLQIAGIQTGIKIHLEKRLPLAAGLGGGSGNAAVTLLALNELLDHPLSAEQLCPLAASLGSDVPFFLQSLPALATGRGEQIKPLDWFPALQHMFLLLIHPGFGVSTVWAYSALAQFPEALNGKRGRAEELVSALRQPWIKPAASLLYNALEAPVLRKHPILELYQEFLRERGALATLMSGSGSTTFALLQSQAAAQDLRAQFIRHFGETCWTAVARLRSN